MTGSDEVRIAGAAAVAAPNTVGVGERLRAMTTLSRQHYKRLRFYWQGRGHGCAGNADGVDLDLAAAGLVIRQERNFGGVYFAITNAGEVELAAEKAREIERRRPHHALAGRVAQWLRDQGRVTWENIELLVDRDAGGRQAIRPDVFSMAATYDEKRINPCVGIWTRQ
ncbi:hypothetical protein [Burkholderia ubonensis]|uniref:hypothetical protein n=1 Tax=Burkholderia ubonensis TaxID=101571 RepID=UPI000AB9B8BC|nr:hypothetical protein [Burkholderia ubonensis]